VEPYAQSKLEAEQSLAHCCAATGMQLVVLRPVLVYGRNAPGNFARLLNAVRAGRILPIGGFDNRRSLLAVENLVQLIELCMRHPQAANQVFLAADGDDVSTPELARLIGAAIGKPARLLHLPLGLLRPLARLLGKSRELERLCGSLQADIGKARSLLGWQPALSLRQALQKLCDVD
jgi:nucleoside-diphosphate-sugar epimerase